MKSLKSSGFLTAACYFAIFNATTVSAHPGHGVDVDGNSVAHYFTSPMHVASFFLVASVIAAFCFTGARRSRRAVQPTNA